jgi:hypothetical protein
MKLITFYTPSHECLVKRLLASRVEEYTLAVVEGEQEGIGAYRQKGFHRSVLSKMRAIRKEATEDFVFADADVVFLKPSLERILKEAEGYDCLFQRDDIAYCTGLFFMRHKPGCLNLLDNIVAVLELRRDDDRVHDQTVAQRLLPKSGLRYGHLSDLFANLCTIYGHDWHAKGRSPIVPAATVVFHANWVAGVERKLMLLEIAEGKYTVDDIKKDCPLRTSK